MNLHTSRRQRGLTLIELTIVLLVLAAVAGVMVPRLTGYAGRSHGAAGAANVQEISKAVTLFEANSGSLPTRWENLVEDVPGTAALFTKLVESGVTNAHLTMTALSAGQEQALAEAGVTTLVNMGAGDEPDFNATFNPYESPADTYTLDSPGDAAVENVATLQPAAVTALGLTAGNTYAVFGVGKQSDMIGSAMIDAPLHFPEGGEDPESVYLRWLAVFDLGPAATPLEKARFVGVVSMEPGEGEVTGGDDHLKEFFENR